MNLLLNFFHSFYYLFHRDARILELLYEEARYNVLYGRYIMEPAHSIMLGGIQARIECGPYNSNLHTTSYFRYKNNLIFNASLMQLN